MVQGSYKHVPGTVVWQHARLANFDDRAAAHFDGVRTRWVESQAVVKEDESVMLAPEVESALAELCGKVEVPARIDMHGAHRLRLELKAQLRKQVLALERRCDKLKRGKGGLSKRVRAKRAQVEFQRALRFILDPKSLKDRIFHLAEQFYKGGSTTTTTTTTAKDNDEEKRPELKVTDLSAEAVDALFAEAPASALAEARFAVHDRRTRPLALPKFKHDIAALTKARVDEAAANSNDDGGGDDEPYESCDDDDAADDDHALTKAPAPVPASQAVTRIHGRRAQRTRKEVEAPSTVRRERTPRERYLTSVLSRLIVQHKSGQTILEDYPVPQRFQDALEAFPGAGGATSVTELGFDMVRVDGGGAEAAPGDGDGASPSSSSLEKQKLVIFRPKPFIKLDVDDDGGEGLFSLRPPVSNDALGLLGSSKTPDEVRAIISELRWQLQSGERHAKASLEEVVRSIRSEVEERHRTTSTLEAPLQVWSVVSLGALAVTRELSPRRVVDYDAPPPTRAAAAAKGGATTKAAAAAAAAAAAEARGAAARGTPGESSVAPISTFEAPTDVALRGHAALERAVVALSRNAAIDALDAVAAVAVPDPNRRPKLAIYGEPRTSEGISQGDDDEDDEELVWAAEPSPQPISVELYGRIETLWDLIDMGDLRRLDFVCKYSHRHFAPDLPAVVALYEGIPASLRLSETAVDFLVEKLPGVSNDVKGDLCTEAAGKIGVLDEALTKLAATATTLLRDHAEKAFIREDDLAKEVFKFRARVLAALPKGYFDDACRSVDVEADTATAASTTTNLLLSPEAPISEEAFRLTARRTGSHASADHRPVENDGGSAPAPATESPAQTSTDLASPSFSSSRLLQSPGGDSASRSCGTEDVSCES